MPAKLIHCPGVVWLALLTLTAGLSTAHAHGEKALEPFIRMRTIQWYDVAWSKADVKVNDELTITGKFHVAEDWPLSVPRPEAAYLNVATPGPVFVRTERYLNGQPFMTSVALKLGGDYDFKIVLKARMPGRYHIHPFFNLIDAGAVVGPGHWVEVTGSPGAFTNPVETLDGEVIDLETYGTVNGIFWHALWFAIAGAWLLWWLRRPLFIPRYQLLRAGHEDALITPRDRVIAKAILIGVPLAVFGANAMTQNLHPHAIPLQAARDRIEPLSPPLSGEIEARVQKAEYQLVKRSMVMTTQVTNTADRPIRVGEFTTASVRFINSDLGRLADGGYPENSFAANGLSVDRPDPIEPGETAILKISATDGAWETERLDGLIRDADSRLGGLLFFYDADGRRFLTSVSAPVFPKLD